MCFLTKELPFLLTAAFGMGMIVEIHDQQTMLSIGQKSANATFNMIKR